MKTNKEQRKRRTRNKISGNAIRPRLSVFRSNKYIYAQVIDDEQGRTLVSASEKEIDTKIADKLGRAAALGESLAKKALGKKIKKVVFDRGAYAYHGRVQALAEGARKGGLEC